MKIRELFDRQTARSLLGYIFLLTTFIFSGCAYGPILVSPWDFDHAEYPLVPVSTASLDVTVIQSVPPGAHTVTFNFLKKGTTIWWESPGKTADKWRLVLYGPGKDGKNVTLCTKDWTEEPSKTSDKIIYVTCDFKSPEQLMSVLGQHTFGLLDFRLQGESKSDFTDSERKVDFSAYFVSDSKVCEKIDKEYKCVNEK